MMPRKIVALAGRALLSAGLAAGILFATSGVAQADPTWTSQPTIAEDPTWTQGPYSTMQDPTWT